MINQISAGDILTVEKLNEIISNTNNIVSDVLAISGLSEMIEDIEQAQIDYNGIEQSISSMEEDSAQLALDIPILSEDVDTLASDVSALEGTVTSIEGTVSILDSDYDAFVGLVNTQDLEINTAIDNLDALEIIVGNLMSDMIQLQADIEYLQTHGSSIGMTADENITVGSGGTYATLTLAINYCKTLIPCGHRVFISLLTGFAMNEQILLQNCDLSFVKITHAVGGTVVMVGTSSLTVGVSYDDGVTTVYPAFSGVNAKLPVIELTFRLDVDRVVGKVGMLLVGENACGIINGTNCGFQYFATNLLTAKMARASAQKSVLDHGNKGIYALSQSVANVSYASLSYSDLYSIDSRDGAKVFACKCYANYDFKAIICFNAEVFMTGTTGNVELIDTYYGGILHVDGTTGTTNIAINSVTADGIIFR
jgi:hypothetical protein